MGFLQCVSFYTGVPPYADVFMIEARFSGEVTLINGQPMCLVTFNCVFHTSMYKHCTFPFQFITRVTEPVLSFGRPCPCRLPPRPCRFTRGWVWRALRGVWTGVVSSLAVRPLSTTQIQATVPCAIYSCLKPGLMPRLATHGSHVR